MANMNLFAVFSFSGVSISLMESGNQATGSQGTEDLPVCGIHRMNTIKFRISSMVKRADQLSKGG